MEEEESRKKQLISIRVWEDEYLIFKALCREWRTTPTAKLNEFIRVTVQNNCNYINGRKL